MKRKGSLAGEPGLGDLVTAQGSSTSALTCAARCLREKAGLRSNLTCCFFFFLETEWQESGRSFAPELSETAGLGVPSNRFPGGQGSSARG